MRISHRGIQAGLLLVCFAAPAGAQVIGSYDNFDCFNDTGQTAEGFEIDVEDVAKADITREFPSNFSSTPWVIRYGLPTMTAYDWTVATPDAQHSADAGHKGVLITWAAVWNGTGWVAAYGDHPFSPTQNAGNGTPYVPKPAYTNGDSCWFYGLGQAYPSSGCDHFGISFAYTARPGAIFYHWKLPDPANPGHLVNAALEASLPPTPSLVYNPPAPGAAPVVVAVAEAPEREKDQALNPNLQFGAAYWVKVTTLFGPRRAGLDALQKANVAKAAAKKVVTWGLLQRPPKLIAGAAEHEDVEHDAIPAGDIAETKQYEYFKFSGAFKAEDHEVLCNPAVKCKQPTTVTYQIKTKGKGGGAVTVLNGDLGDYIGAHVNAINIK